jgi:hypothetical protein
MPDKTPKEVAATVMSQRARSSSRIAGQTSPGPKGPNKAKDPKSPSFTIVESTARPSSTADNASTSSVVSEHNTKSPAREQDNATLPSQSKKDAVEERSDDGNESTPPRARAVKGVVM